MNEMKNSNIIQPDVEGIRKAFAASSVPVICGAAAPQTIMLPSHDGTKLRTVITRPDSGDRWPVIAVRTCYFKREALYAADAKEYNMRGFAYVYQFCRGTAGSEGDWEPNVNERADGKSFLDWLQAEEWAESIGYFGNSYLALTGWTVADIIPEKVRTMYLADYGTRRHTSAYMDGLFRHDILTGWTMKNAGKAIDADYLESCRHLPMNTVDEDLWGVRLEWFREWLHAESRSSEYWKQGFWSMLADIPSKIQIPVYIGEGWFDHHLGSSLEMFRDLPEEVREKCVLRIGAWDHFHNTRTGAYEADHSENNVKKSAIEWFYNILVKKEIPKGRADFYIIGSDTWISSLDSNEDLKVRRFYLSTCGLQSSLPEDASVLSYKYDPSDPVISCGGEALLTSTDLIGSLPQPSPGYRSDVLSFISEPLEEDMTIFGSMYAKLYAASDSSDTAFIVKFMDVFPDGIAYNLRTAATTLGFRNGAPERLSYSPCEVAEFGISAWDIAWTVKKGHRIRIDVTSSDFPQYALHCNYAGPWADQTQYKTACQKIFLGGETPSYIEFPVIRVV